MNNKNIPSEPISKKPSFAILIPTFNRHSMLRHTLLKHCSIIEKQFIGNVDVVVSDNMSPDDTEATVREVAERYPYVKYIKQPRHYNTGEEHIFNACRAVDYEYVWLFGDDDLPRPHGLRRILELVGTRRYDFITMNMRSLMAHDLSIHPGRNPDQGLIAETEDAEMDIRDMVAAFGFQSVIACVSAVAFRRQCLVDAPLDHIYGISPIYSHVTSYLQAFSNKRGFYIGEPLIDYRVGATRMSNWHNFAEKSGQIVGAPWTIGVVRLFKYLRTNGFVDANLLFETREHDSQNRYYLWCHVLDAVCRMCQEALRLRSVENMLAPLQYNEIVTEFAEADAEGNMFDLAHKLGQVLNVVYGAFKPYERGENEDPTQVTLAPQSLSRLLHTVDEDMVKDVVDHVQDWVDNELLLIRSKFTAPESYTFVRHVRQSFSIG